MPRLMNKAVIIENGAQLEEFKRLCRNKNISYIITKKSLTPFAYMMIRVHDNFYGVPNDDFSTGEYGIKNMGFTNITIRQFKSIIAEDSENE